MGLKTKIFAGFMFSFGFAFITYGYASMSDNFVIQGEVGYEPPKKVFITNVETLSGNAVTNGYVLSTHNSTVTLGNSGTSNATFEITVYNNIVSRNEIVEVLPSCSFSGFFYLI